MKPEEEAIERWEKAYEKKMTEDEKIMFRHGFASGSVAVTLALVNRNKS